MRKLDQRDFDLHKQRLALQSQELPKQLPALGAYLTSPQVQNKFNRSIVIAASIVLDEPAEPDQEGTAAHEPENQRNDSAATFAFQPIPHGVAAEHHHDQPDSHRVH